MASTLYDFAYFGLWKALYYLRMVAMVPRNDSACPVSKKPASNGYKIQLGFDVKALASFIMRGRIQAIIFTVVCAGLSLLLSPLNLLTGAGIALVTLRKGVHEGLLVTGGAAVVLAGLAVLATQNATLSMIFLVSLSISVLPVMLLAWVLRSTLSLGYTLSVAAMLGIFAVLLMYVVVGDPIMWWQETMIVALEPALEQAKLSLGPAEIDQMIASIAGWMTGIVAAALITGFLTSLFIGRTWQALLYNPDGFKQEYHSLSLGNKLGIFTLLVALIAMVTSGTLASMSGDILWVLWVVYLFVGLAIVHRVVEVKSWSIAILVALYVGLIIPQVAMLVSLLGWADTRLNFRSRLGVSGNTGDKS